MHESQDYSMNNFHLIQKTMKQILTLIFVSSMFLSIFGQSDPAIYSSRISGLNNRQFLSHPDAYNPHSGLKVPGMMPKPAKNNYELKKSLATMQALSNFLYQTYNESTEQWENSSMDEFAYNISGQNTSDTYSSWDVEMSAWILLGKQEFIYDGSGNMVQEVYYNWDESTSSWEQNYRWLYTYNGEGNISLGYSYFWDDTSNSWVMAGRIVRAYDSQGNMLSETSSYWSQPSNSWINSSRSMNEYNSSNQILLSTYQMWDFISSDWINMDKTEYEYNSGDMLIKIQEFTWNSTSGEWENDYMDEFSYDSFMNMVMDMQYEWDGSSWIVSGKSEYLYNNDYTANELIYPWYYGQASEGLQHMLVEVIDYMGSTFDPESKSTYTYTELNTTGVVEDRMANMSIFPQPADETVTFTWNNPDKDMKLMIYASNGQMVIEKSISQNEKVDLSSTTSGIYFYRLVATDRNEIIYSGKLTVR
jgi:hypothetical protein